MLIRRINAVSCEKHTEHKNALYGQNTEINYVKANVTYNNQWLKCFKLGTIPERLTGLTEEN
jgi:hypothetical protein